MVNATTHSADGVLLDRVRSQANVMRIGAGTFWCLVALELALLMGGLFWLLAGSTTPRTPAAATGDLLTVRDAVWSRLGGVTDDPLIEINQGVSARASSLRGLKLNGTVYYYYVEGGKNFDPLSRGFVGQDTVEILLRDEGGPQTLVIYTIHNA